MIKAFLSYSHVDKEIAVYIAQELRARGVDVFIDEIGLRPGNYWKQLGKEIRICEYFIVLLSPNSANSKWVQKEISWACISKPEEKIIPVLVKPLSQSDWEPIFHLTDTQYVDFTNWYLERDADEAVIKLAEYMDLSVKPIIEPAPILEAEEWEGSLHEEEEEEDGEPWLSLNDIIKLLEASQSASHTNASPSDLRRADFLCAQALSGLDSYITRLRKKS